MKKENNEICYVKCDLINKRTLNYVSEITKVNKQCNNRFSS